MLTNITSIDIGCLKRKVVVFVFVHFSASKGNKGACKYYISRFFQILDPP